MQKTFTLLVCLTFCFYLSGYSVTLPEASPLIPYTDELSAMNFAVTQDKVTRIDPEAGSVASEAPDENKTDSVIKFRIFPNPATDYIRIEWQTAVHKEIHAELYDLFGRRISHEKAGDSDNHIQIDIQAFQRSAYLLKIFTADGEFSKTYRVIKH